MAACSEEPGWFARELRRFLSYPRLDKAYRLLQRGDLAGARAELDHALKADPDNPTLVAERFGIALGEGDLAGAEGLAMRMAGDPAFTAAQRRQARDLLADAALRDDRAQTVIDLLGEVGKFAPDRMRLGYARMKLGNGARALEDFSAAAGLARGEERMSALRAVGNAALVIGNAGRAEQAVAEGLALAPGDAELLRLRALMAERSGNLAVAAQAFAASLKGDAPAADWARASRLLLAAGRAGEAADAARTGLSQANADERPLLAVSLARARSALGDRTVALGSLPDDLALEWSADLAARGRHWDALAALGSMSGDEAHRRRAVLLERLGRPAKAAAELALLSQSSTETETRRAMLLVQADDLAGAVASLRRAIAIAPDTDRRLYLAELERRRGRVGVAIGELESLVDSLPAGSPARLEALMRLGRLAAAAKRPEPAARAFAAAFRESGRDDAAAAAVEALLAAGQAGQAVALRPRPDVLERAAEVQAGQGRLADSIATLKLLAAKSPVGSPQHLQALTRLGHRALAAGRPEQAAEAFRAAYAAVPGGDPVLMQAAAYAYQRAGQIDEAATFLTGIAADAPHGPAARRLLAELMLDAGRRGDAVAALSGLAGHGALPRDLLQLGFLLREDGNCPAAVPILAAAAMRGSGAVARLTEALCLKDMAQDDAALALLEKLEIPPSWEAGTRQTAYATLATLLAKKDRHGEAARAWLAAEQAGGPARLALWRAHSLRRSGGLDQAARVLAAVDLATLSGSDQVVFLDEASELALARDDLPAAASAIARALELRPESRRSVALGRVAERMGRIEQAEEAFRQAGTEAELDLAYFYRRMGRDAEAVPLLENVVERAPEDSRLHEELGYALKRVGASARSVRSFRAALDLLAQEDAGRAYRLRREVVELERSFSGSLYLGYDGRDAIGATNPVNRTTAGSVLGGELAWRVPEVSADDPNRLQLYASGYTGSTDGETPEGEAAQLQFGLRYKPLTDQNLVLSAGRLVALGNQALNGWVVGAGYSYADRADLDPARSIANYTALDAGASLVFGADDGFYANAELIQGVGFRLDEVSTLVPHVVVAAQYLDEDAGSASRIAIGPGIRYTLWPDEDKHRAGSVSVNLDLQYRFDVAGSRQEGSGPFVRLSIRF